VHRTLASSSLLLLLATSTSCIRIAGGGLSPIQPPTPSTAGTLEDTVGDFGLTPPGSALITDNKAGRNVNLALLGRWIRRGYIVAHAYVPKGQFSGKADYNLTLSGVEDAESPTALRIASSCTAFLVPFSENYRFDIQYTLENVKTGAKYSAGVEDGYKKWTHLFLLFAAPFADNGAQRTLDDMADHLYEQLRTQGAFGP
jgi:hypothetical protein